MKTEKIPTWIIAYGILQLVLAVLFGVMAYANRGFQFPELIDVAGALFPIGLFANRNLGVAIALGAALFLRRRDMLFILFLVRFATDLFDFFLGMANAESFSVGTIIVQMVFFALILWIPELFAMRHLWQDGQTAA